MVLDQIFKLLHILEKLLIPVFGNGVSWHRNIHNNTLSFNFRVDFRDSACCNLRFEVIIGSAIFERKKALAHWIAITHSTVVNERELYVSPT